ncbi:hypothetical protein BKK79_38080 (plasmid) [Cupriavidus sp. USMAA2-4]|jgi:hypothetical protein|uniref:hypothetical protein n=1 Tax=unclassified Cupriavidus TaxID=2640874 RepID=UPI0008A6D2BC|nr:MULTISPECIES: hypothetical protein [unclassified Cupriavidus]AOY97733.1 hypothetical protein BKK79_38080 [Cupriavidus sp. USMAA2-4]AOZ04230.1 hypothetical protein BKK81_33080 [Cupriavidus sp. USMAHM13]
MQRPYIVRLSAVAVIMAADNASAEHAARRCQAAILSDAAQLDIRVDGPVAGLSELPGGWRAHEIPYGGDGRTSLEQLLRCIPPMHPRDDRTIDMFSDDAQPSSRSPT